jgi:YggT family protein
MSLVVIDILRLLLDTLGALVGVTLLLRAYMNWVGMPSRNPLQQFAIALTDWAVRPLRRVVPAVGRWDTASLVAAYLVAVLMMVLTLALLGAGLGAWQLGTVLYGALLLVLRWCLYTVLFLTVVHVVLSWVNPYAPVAPAVAMLVRPFLAPFQRILPAIGNIDFSPLVLLLVVNVLLLILNRL